jgi:rfaE bifunctional protein nucleotidyltransferase chain/domain
MSPTEIRHSDMSDDPSVPSSSDARHRAATVPGSGLFADASNFELRYVPDYESITNITNSLRVLGMKVVLTSGTFDILHEGHSMYLEAARRFGDFLIVGVDSDEKVRRRKGRGRPAVPEAERLRMLTHQRGVGLVTLKGPNDPRWALIDAVRPDVLVATADTYSAAEIAELEAKYCGHVEVLERMATVSTSARLRLLQLGLAESLSERVTEELSQRVSRVTEELSQHVSRISEELLDLFRKVVDDLRKDP